jgi:hypothetical protein
MLHRRNAKDSLWGVQEKQKEDRAKMRLYGDIFCC